MYLTVIASYLKMNALTCKSICLMTKILFHWCCLSSSSWSITVWLVSCKVFFILLCRSVKNKFLFTMTAYPGQTLTTPGQLCAALWDSQSRMWYSLESEPGSVVTSLALRCSALDRCATREPNLESSIPRSCPSRDAEQRAGFNG
jgi:hypothetical protein